MTKGRFLLFLMRNVRSEAAVEASEDEAWQGLEEIGRARVEQTPFDSRVTDGLWREAHARGLIDDEAAAERSEIDIRRRRAAASDAMSKMKAQADREAASNEASPTVDDRATGEVRTGAPPPARSNLEAPLTRFVRRARQLRIGVVALGAATVLAGLITGWLIRSADVHLNMPHINGAGMTTFVVLGGFGLVLVVAAFIVTEVLAGLRRDRNDEVEMTAGRVIRVRGPVRGQLESGAPAIYTEVTVQYYTRRGEGPFEISRKLPHGTRVRYSRDDRVIVSYDIRTPRRARIAGRVSHWPDLLLGKATGAVHSPGDGPVHSS